MGIAFATKRLPKRFHLLGPPQLNSHNIIYTNHSCLQKIIVHCKTAQFKYYKTQLRHEEAINELNQRLLEGNLYVESPYDVRLAEPLLRVHVQFECILAFHSCMVLPTSTYLSGKLLSQKGKTASHPNRKCRDLPIQTEFSSQKARH